jgi:hypothetical protein
MTYSDDSAAIRALLTRLQSQFDSAYASHYTSYGGVDMVSQQDEPGEPQQVGKPYTVFRQTNGQSSEWAAAADDWRDVELDGTVTVNGFNGGLVGAENPTASDELISKDLVQEFINNRAAWDALGLYDIECRPQSETVREGVQRTPHRISFRYEVT